MVEKNKIEQTLAEVVWEKDETIGRLAKENAGLRERLQEAQSLCAEVIPDGERLSLRGAIRALQKRIRQLEDELRNGGLDVPKI